MDAAAGRSAAGYAAAAVQHAAEALLRAALLQELPVPLPQEPWAAVVQASPLVQVPVALQLQERLVQVLQQVQASLLVRVPVELQLRELPEQMQLQALVPLLPLQASHQAVRTCAS
ncbi:hypothetical protein D9M68_817340 [compost metagenome]